MPIVNGMKHFKIYIHFEKHIYAEQSFFKLPFKARDVGTLDKQVHSTLVFKTRRFAHV